MMTKTLTLLVIWLYVLMTLSAAADSSTQSGDTDLTIVSDGRSTAKIVVSPQAGEWERRAAEDLAHFIELMTGAKIPILSDRESIDAALVRGALRRRSTPLESSFPLLILGQEAIDANPDLQKAIQNVLKKSPKLRTDGIALIRKDNHIFLAGNNDRSHYFATSELLRR